MPCRLEIRITKSQNASAYELDSIRTSTVLFKARCKFYPALTILSFFSTYGYQTNTNQIRFSAVHILHRTPQQARSSLWLSSSCPAIFYISTLCWSSQANMWKTPHLKSCHQSTRTALPHFGSCLFAWLLLLAACRYQRVRFRNWCLSLFYRQNRRHAVEHSSQSCMGSHMTVLLLRFSSGADACTLCCGTPHPQPEMPSIIQILTNQALGTLGTRYSNQIKAVVNTHCFISTTLENITLIIETVNKTMTFVQ